MPPKSNANRALAASLAAASLAAPSALAGDMWTPDARNAAPKHAQHRSDSATGGMRAPDLHAPDAADAADPVAPTPDARTPAPTVVEVTSAQRFDWASAGIGAGAGIALALIAVAASTSFTGRSRPARH
jgi:hypothetical protein